MNRRALILPLIDQALVSASGFISTVMLARHLPIDQFGAYSLAWTIVLFVGGIQSALILFPMMSIGPRKADSERVEFYSELMAQQFAFAVICAAAMFTGAFLLGMYAVSERMPISFSFSRALALGVAGGICQMQEFLRRLLFTDGRPAAALVSDGLRYGGQVAMLALAFVFGLDSVDAVLWVSSLTSTAALLAFPRYVILIRFEPMKLLSQFQRNWSFSGWLVGSSLLSWLSTQSSVVLTGILLGPAEVGALRGCQNLVGAGGVLLQALQNVIPLQAAQNYANDGPKGLNRFLVRTGLLVSAVIGIFVVCLSAAPGLWLHLAYGQKYAGFGYLLIWCAVSFFVSSLEMPLSIGLRTAERTRPTFVAYLAGAAVTVFSIYPLATEFGLTGVVAATTATWAVQNTVMLAGLLIIMREIKAAKPSR
jgi:O-antigen/teichoic acid export membrane protein